LGAETEHERQPQLEEAVEERRADGRRARDPESLQRDRHRHLDDADSLEDRRQHQEKRADRVAAERRRQRRLNGNGP
jgi:hypothetical protein